MTLWNYIKEDWVIKKSVIKNELSIDPNKQWSDITRNELGKLADYLDVRIKDIID